MKKKLSNVTLIGVEGCSLEYFIPAFTICTTLCEFEDIKLLTTFDPINSYMCKIPQMDYEGYNKFLVKEVHKYCNTSHMLIFQYDGFILNPDAWSNTFLNYDWIGARWWHHQTGITSGNGGFSLRSKNLMEWVSNNINVEKYAPEDDVLLRQNGHKILNAGFKVNTNEIAMQFSQEFGHWNGSFGFHGRGTNLNNWLNSSSVSEEVQKAKQIYIENSFSKFITA